MATISPTAAPVELAAAAKPDTALQRALPMVAAVGEAAASGAASGLGAVVGRWERWFSQLAWGSIAAVFMIVFYRDMRADQLYQRDVYAQQNQQLVSAIHALQSKMDARAAAEESMAAEMRASRLAIEALVRDIRTQTRP